MSRLPRGVRGHMRRTLAPPYRRDPPTDRAMSGGGGYDPWHTASCPYCHWPLHYGSPGYGKGRVVGLVCTPLRRERCVQAALLLVRHGPEDGNPLIPL